MNIFAAHALDLLSRGVAVLPAKEKRPLIRGFAGWDRPPSPAAVAKWARQFPDANLAYNVAASGLVVVDADDAAAVADARALFGETPGRVKTNRGEHALYRAPKTPMLDVALSLRNFGLNADLKLGNRGQSIAIAPPSRHPSGTSYQWIECDASVLAHLPPFDIDALKKLVPLEKLARAPLQMRDGSRGQWLNDHLCSHVPHCDSFDELLDVAHTANDDLTTTGYLPLDDSAVIERAKKVYADFQAGKIEAMHRSEASVKFQNREVILLGRLGARHAPDALFLLAQLRINHSVRCAAGATFCITPKAMANAQVIPGWTRERYEKARDLLLTAGLIAMVSPLRTENGARIAAQYRFAERKKGGRSVTLG